MFETEESAWERAKVYELFAGVFLKEPTLEGLAILKNWAEDLEEVSELNALLQEIETEDPELEALVQDYYDLFFVPVSGRFVPPFEAAIRGAQRQKGRKTKFGGFWGNSTLELMHFYQGIGFDPKQLAVFQPLKESNIPDHLGFELCALAYLCYAEETKIKEGQDADHLRHLQKTLLDEHLNQWLDLLQKDLKKVDRTGLYACLVGLISDFCRQEAQSLVYPVTTLKTIQ